VEDVEEVEDIEEEEEEEEEAAEAEAEPSTRKAKAMRVRTKTARGKHGAHIQRGPGASAAPTRILKANGHPQIRRVGVLEPNVRSPFVALQTSSKLESGSGQAMRNAHGL